VTRQRTIKETVTVEGIGLQTGKKVSLTFRSSPADSGINFIRTDLPNKPLLNLQSMVLSGAHGPERRTTLSLGPMQIQTTEHLLAALSGYSIDNIVIELDNVELPGLDGSAKGFLDALEKAGAVEQDQPRRSLKVSEPVWCRSDDRILAAFPSDEFRVSYTMSYADDCLGTWLYYFDRGKNSFKKEIAPARTFCLEKEAMVLLKLGLGKGANYDNTLVMSRNGPVKNKLRFPDEPVRHKVLDLIGDLYLLGMPVIGHIVAVKSGHSLNMELVKALRSKIF